MLRAESQSRLENLTEATRLQYRMEKELEMKRADFKTARKANLANVMKLHAKLDLVTKQVQFLTLFSVTLLFNAKLSPNIVNTGSCNGQVNYWKRLQVC